VGTACSSVVGLCDYNSVVGLGISVGGGLFKSYSESKNCATLTMAITLSVVD